MNNVFSSLICYCVNTLCCKLYQKDYQAFLKTKDLARMQKNKLLETLTRNRESVYGRLYNFKNIQDVHQYQDQVPLTTYEDYAPYIERICDGESSVLTLDRVSMLEPTSGSTSAAKLVVYTDALKKEFQNGLKPWFYSLYTNYPGIRWGKSYWSITPVTHNTKYTSAGIPVGFEEDSQYFGKLEEYLFNWIFAVPSKLVKHCSMEEFYYKTALNLLACENLTLISIWNPTFLLLVLEFMDKNQKVLIQDLYTRDPKRATFLENVLLNKEYASVWPDLVVISCWCHGNARKYVHEIKTLFPKAVVEPKGVLATEGLISFPVNGLAGSALSVYSHFFEFQSLEDNQLYLAHQLEEHKDYAVIITTAGGFYRYQLRDVIKVCGFMGEIPLICFVGKQDRVSDLFGEKLNEVFVKEVLEGLQISGFAMLAPKDNFYVLFTTFPIDAEMVDQGLRTNYHYNYCRKLGQLKPVRIFRLTGDPLQEYLGECVKAGQRLGDIKLSALSLHSHWDTVFKGEYL